MSDRCGGLDAGVSRRAVIKLGGLAMLNFSLPELLRAEASGAGASEKSCILIVQQGGPSHLDTWDPKPDAPEEIRGPFQPIATRTAGLHVCELLPQLAGLSDRYAVIRSMMQPSADHLAGMHICLSGRSNPAPDAPYLGSILSKVRPATRNIPPYVWLQNFEYDVGKRYETGGHLGQAYAPLRVGNYLDNPSSPDFHFREFDPQPDVSAARLSNRRGLLESLDTHDRTLEQDASADGLQQFRERAFDLISGSQARQAFDVSRESDAVRDNYGRHPLGQNLLLARRLIEAGVRLVSINAWTGVAPGEKMVTINVWDGHGGISYIGNTFATGTYGLRFMLPRLDQAVSALLEDLRQRGLLANTLVAMLGEFGRTPKITGAGRDHWPYAYSSVLAGAGVRGGTVYGASDRQGMHVVERAVIPETFGATVLHALGVPPETRLQTSGDAFTNRASPGQPILELFG